jgi:hypothetical protein
VTGVNADLGTEHGPEPARPATPHATGVSLERAPADVGIDD